MLWSGKLFGVKDQRINTPLATAGHIKLPQHCQSSQRQFPNIWARLGANKILFTSIYEKILSKMGRLKCVFNLKVCFLIVS